MQTRRTPWRPSYLRSKLLAIPLPLLFVAMNLLILVQGARPHSPGTIARFWWPAITGFIFAGSFVYWCGLMLLQARIPLTEFTVGEVIGFKVIVRYENDEDIPNDFQRVLAQARNDGSRRRVEYQVREFVFRFFAGSTRMGRFADVLRLRSMASRSLSATGLNLLEICFRSTSGERTL